MGFKPTILRSRVHGERGHVEKTKFLVLSGKTQGIWKFCQNTGNVVAQDVNSLTLNVMNIAMLAAMIFMFFLEAGYICQVSFVYVIHVIHVVTSHVNWHICGLDRGKNREF